MTRRTKPKIWRMRVVSQSKPWWLAYEDKVVRFKTFDDVVRAVEYLQWQKARMKDELAAVQS